MSQPLSSRDKLPYGSTLQRIPSNPRFGVPSFPVSPTNMPPVSPAWHGASAKNFDQIHGDAIAPAPPEQFRQWLSDSPWAARDSFQIQAGGLAAAGQPNVGQMYMAHFYRTATEVTSECETVPDSGYGSSQPKYSLMSTTSHDDETQPQSRPLEPRFLDQLEGFNFEATPVSPISELPEPQKETKKPPKPQSADVNDLKFKCPHCPEKLRTQSEHKKHVQKHEKPFRCDHTDCGNPVKGFGSSNDLARHKKSVHGEYGPEDSVYYVCWHDGCGKMEESKKWPRSDNFCSHLKRVHGVTLGPGKSLQQYIHRPTRTQELKGVGTAVSCVNPESSSINLNDPNGMLYDEDLARLAIPGRELMTSNQIELGACLHTGSTTLEGNQTILQSPGDPGYAYIRPVILNQRLSHQDISAMPVEEDNSQRLAANKDLLPRREEDDADYTAEQEEQHQDDGVSSEGDNLETPTIDGQGKDDYFQQSFYPDSSAPPSDDDEAQTERFRSRRPESVLEVLLNETDPAQLLKALKSLPKVLLETALQSNSRDEEGEPQGGAEARLQKCPECDKMFKRPCELKKHQRRHDRPYGCTYYDCNRAFGSKNDWKRHESSQHSQLETWNCEEQGCLKICDRRESFKAHLQKDHEIEDPKVIDEKLDRSRIGRHDDRRFWCGFCVRVIEIKEEGVNMWTKRCNHIDNHLFAKEGFSHKRIKDWKHLEVIRAERDVADAAMATRLLKNKSGQQSLKVGSGANRPGAATRKRPPTQDLDPRPSKKTDESRFEFEWICVSLPPPGAEFDDDSSH